MAEQVMAEQKRSTSKRYPQELKDRAVRMVGTVRTASTPGAELSGDRGPVTADRSRDLIVGLAGTTPGLDPGAFDVAPETARGGDCPGSSSARESRRDGVCHCSGCERCRCCRRCCRRRCRRGRRSSRRCCRGAWNLGAADHREVLREVVIGQVQ